MARYVLTPFGGISEVSSFIWLARLLVERGHEVKVLGAPMFGNAVIAAGFDFTCVGHDEDYSGFLQDPGLGDPAKASKLVLRFGNRILHAFYDAICMALMVEPAVLISSIHHPAARAVREKYPVPLVALHAQPSWPLDENATGANAGTEVWLPKPSLDLEWVNSGHAGCMTAGMAPAMRKFCEDIKIKAPRQRLQKWMHSPDLDIMLFPEWFYGVRSDSSANIVFDGFPLGDPAASISLPDNLCAFLESGDEPVLLTLENRSAWSQAFYETGLRACALLGVRALLANCHTDLLPDLLPSWAHAIEPHLFGEIIPRARAVVHDGGIGTLSQCLAAGVPQLITPMLRGQQGNAARIRWLGTGESLIPAQYSVENAASSLLRLTSSEFVRTACDSVKGLCKQKGAGSRAIEALEDIARARRTSWVAGRGFCRSKLRHPQAPQL